MQKDLEETTDGKSLMWSKNKRGPNTVLEWVELIGY